MNFLFDASPEELPDTKKSKPRRRAAKPDESQKIAAEDTGGVAIFAHQRRRNDTIIGRSDGHYECADIKCGSSHFDILDEWRGEWFVECMICGTGQSVPAISGVISTPDAAGEFVFADGRYEGLSVSQVVLDENGPTYLSWAAANHKREAVRIACKKWIDSIRIKA